MLSAVVLGLPGDVVEALQSLRENDRIKAELKFFGKTVKGLSREEFEEALYRALAGEYTREEQSKPQSVVWSIPEAEFDELYRKAQNEELKTVEAWEAELARLRKRYGIPEPRPEKAPETETEGPETEETPPPEGDREHETEANHPPILWDSWQNYEKVSVNGHVYAKVGNRLYSRHAVERMQPSGNRFGVNIYVGLWGESYGRSIAPQLL